jgi:hypothetical protein
MRLELAAIICDKAVSVAVVSPEIVAASIGNGTNNGWEDDNGGGLE